MVVIRTAPDYRNELNESESKDALLMVDVNRDYLQEFWIGKNHFFGYLRNWKSKNCQFQDIT